MVRRGAASLDRGDPEATMHCAMAKRLATDAASLSALFEREYARTFGHSMDEHHEIVTVRALLRLPRGIRHAPRSNGTVPRAGR